MVACPVCNKEIDLEFMNTHLDSGCKEAPLRRANSGNANGGSSLSSILTGNRPRQPQNNRRPRPMEHSLKRSSSEVISIDGDDDVVDQSAERSSPPPRKKRGSSPGAPPPYTATENALRLLEIEKEYLMKESKLPLLERLRPKNLDQYIGQQHLVGEGGILRGFIERETIPSLILWGPPGVGKTTLCRIMSHASNFRFMELSATTHGISDCKKVFEEAKNEFRLTKRRTLLFCDEIHRFNKAQQDIFLPHVEKGDITLIGATTENPSFQLNSALLSRCRVFTLEKLSIEEVRKVLNRLILVTNKTRKLLYNQPILKFSKDAVDYLGDISDGDSRSALNLLEITDSHFANGAGDPEQKFIDISPELLKNILKRTHMIYDRVGDAHYDTISLFHKSIRGSDADAAMYYLARMLKGGENPLYIARRMIRIASEDVGVLDDSCLPFAIAAYKLVQFVGLPEADLALAHCAYKLATLPKSVQIYRAWNRLNLALDNEPNIASAPIPLHLRNAPTKLMKSLDYSKGYKYNPDFLNGEVVQDYLPELAKNLLILDGKHLGDNVDPDIN